MRLNKRINIKIAAANRFTAVGNEHVNLRNIPDLQATIFWCFAGVLACMENFSSPFG